MRVGNPAASALFEDSSETMSRKIPGGAMSRVKIVRNDDGSFSAQRGLFGGGN